MALYNVGFKFENSDQTHSMMVKTEREGLDAIMEDKIWNLMTSSSTSKSKIIIVSAELIWKDGVESNDLIYEFVRLGDICALGKRHFDILSHSEITNEFMDIARGLHIMAVDVVDQIGTLVDALEEFKEERVQIDPTLTPTQ